MLDPIIIYKIVTTLINKLRVYRMIKYNKMGKVQINNKIFILNMRLLNLMKAKDIVIRYWVRINKIISYKIRISKK